MASTEAYNDRHCIASLSKQQSGSSVGAIATMRQLFGTVTTTAKPDVAEFSAEDTLACCKGFSCGLSMGCNGGQPRYNTRIYICTQQLITYIYTLKYTVLLYYYCKVICCPYVPCTH